MAAIALTLFSLQAHAAGLRIERLEARGSDSAPFDAVEVQFNQPIVDGSFTASDIVAFTGPGGNVAVSSVTKVTSQRYVINASGTSLQSYTLEFGPEIRDAANDPLDQDGDGTAGEAGQDVFRARLIADNASIANGDASFDGRALLFAIGAATVDGNHTFAHVEAQRGATPLFQNAGTLTFRSLRADSGASLRIGGGSTANVREDVVVTGASELRLKAKDTFARVGGQWVGAGVTLNAASVNVAAGSSITADGEGYYQQWRSGAEGGPGYSGHGASHGGRGGGDFGPAAVAPYGDAFAPTTLGSGAPTGEHEFSGGGGAIRLNVTGALVLAGEISADGVVGPDCCGGNTYGSSGGSIWATVGTLSGSGKFTADGAAAKPGWDVHAGGGGRIAIYYAADSGFAGFNNSTVDGGGHHAEKGSLIFMDTSVANGRMRITQRLSLDADAEHTFASLAVENGGLLELGGGGTLNVTGALTVSGNSTVRVHAKNTFARVAGVWAGVGATINAASATVESGSIITADGEGYYQQWRSGAEGGPGYNGHGASHGGRGGGDFGPVATPPYGDALQPTTLGSGAPTGEHEFSGGGGAIRLNVTGALVLEGEISADAVVGPDCCGGITYGSSGGSIWAMAGSLSGSGKFTADGAAAAPAWDVHAGGGGRIAVYYGNAASFTGVTGSTVNGGGHHAEKGTLVFIDTSVPGNSIRVTQRLEIPLDQTLTFGAATIENGALVQLNGGATLDIAGKLDVSGNSIIRVQSKNRDAQVGGQWVGRGGTIKAGDLTVAAGSIITADGEGYYNMRGPGLGSDPFYMTATHGGKGTNKTHHSDAAYPGDVYAPIELGTGSYNWVNQYTAGGGAIRIQVDGTFTLNGEVSADAVRFGAESQGSAGGSIWVTTGILRGSGKLTADGGAAESHGNSGGGGGRVAVYYTNDGGFTGFTTSTVNPGSQANGLLSEPGTMFFAQQTSEGLDYRVSQRLHIPTRSAFGARRLVIDDAALFELGGDATAIIREAVTLAENSEVRFMSINTARAIGGEFVGRGSRLYAGSFNVDATSKLNADGFGYGLNAGPGYSPNGGSSHGGRGGNSSQTAPPYGDARAPLELGSGSSGHIYGPPGGGAIELVIGGAFTLDGEITADAVPDPSQNYGGGSGGSVYVRAGSIGGSGSITADGANGNHSGFVSGAGGRIALIHLGEQTLPEANVAANPGTTRPDLPAEPGSRVFEQSDTRFVLLSPASGFAHGDTTIAYAGFGYDPATTRATVEVRRGASVFPVADNQGVVDRLTWDSTAVPDGAASLVVVFRNADGQVIGEGSAPIVINNSVHWHRGTLTANETWAAGAIHIVEEDVLVPNGITLTIAPGVVVKFLPGKRIVAQNGGIVDADGATGAQPILFTSIADDLAGGDTNFDGSATLARPGDWLGVPIEGSGQFLTSGATETRYARFIRMGNIGTQTWSSRTLNVIRTDVTVDSGQTLTIQPGAIVKFEPNRALIVNGTLNAPGTFAQPITFTSLFDDSRGGDSNRDGNTTEPLAGDWRRLTINGTANLEHCYIAYGRGDGNSNVDGMVYVGGTATLRNCTVANALFDGLFVHGNATLENTLVLRTDRALSGQGGTINATNCVIHDNRVGLFGHGGSLNATNCQITANTEFGVQQAGSVPALRFSNVFGNATNYSGTPEQTGTNGNVSIDPKYRAAERDDFHLGFGSLAIDAADGAAAPLQDRSGAPRYDDPRTANTGAAASNGAFADIGAFEFVEAANVASNVDLTVTTVTGPSSAIAGETASVAWTITNVGSETIIGPWFDTVAIRGAGGAVAAVFAGEFEIGAGVVLGPGESFRATALVPVPGATIGKYEWQVTTNTRSTVFEGANFTNNTANAGSTFELDLPELVLNAPALNRAFAAADQPRWFKIQPPAGRQVRVTLDLAGDGITELYAARGKMPTREIHEAKHAQFGTADVTLSIAGTQGQTYYILAYPVTLSANPQAFTIRAESLGLGLESLTLSKISGTGSVTIGFNGSLLSPKGTYELVGPGGTVAAGTINGDDLSRVFATFTLNNLAPGSYTARVTVDGQTVELPNAVTVEPPAVAAAHDLRVKIVGPPAARAGRTTSVTVEVTNPSNRDVYAPLLRVTVQGWAPRPREQTPRLLYMAPAPGRGRVVRVELVPIFELPPPPPQSVEKRFLVFPLNPEGPAGILPPGFTTRIVLEGVPEMEANTASVIAEGLLPDDAFDWPTFAQGAKPAGVPAQAWAIMIQNLKRTLGGKTDSVATQFAKSATYLANVGSRPDDVDDVLGWELQKASNFGDIVRRWTLGPFGYGSTALTPLLNVSTTQVPVAGKHVDASVVEIVYPNGRVRRFTRVAGETDFKAEFAERAVLTQPSEGVFELREPDVTVDRFAALSAGQLTNIPLTERQLALGGTNQFAYDGEGRLVTFTDSVGRQTTLGYNSNGRIATITTARGDTNTFTYNAAGTILTAIKAADGRTTAFEHFADAGTAHENALKKITLSSGVMVEFEYDEAGRIKRQSTNGGQQATTFAYDDQMRVTVTDPEGKSGQVEYGPGGEIIAYDYEGVERVELQFGQLGALAAFGMPASGGMVEFVQNEKRALATVRSARGHASHVDYVPGTEREAGYTDRRGAHTALSYDDPGGRPLVTGITHPDGVTEQFGFDAFGRPTSTQNGRRQSTRFEYNSQGQMTKRTFPDGTFDSFEYHPVNRTLSAIVRHAGAQTHTTSFTYNAQFRTTRIVYPNGRALNFEYNPSGGRTRMFSDDGYDAHYEYDSFGRLARVSNGAGQTQATYEYDAVGRPNKRTLGNGVSTTYGYHPSGRITSVITRRADNAILSSYSYELDKFDRLVRAVTPSGKFTYAYDVEDQLTEIQAPGGRTIRYTYDEEGNRISVEDGGAVASYTANALNQYSAAGGAICEYDRDGNLVKRTVRGQVTTYTYTANNRLASVAGPDGTWSYEYDVLENLTAVTHNGQRTEFLVDPFEFGEVVGEYQNNAATRRYYIGNGVISRSDNGGSQFYVFDGSGHTSALTNAAGAVLNSYEWLPFGEQFGTSSETVPNPVKFSGMYGGLQFGDGFVQMRRRSYDPALGRFTARDPSTHGFGNTYAYCGNNPVGRLDRDGHQESWLSASWKDGSLVANAADGLAGAMEMGVESIARSAEAAVQTRVQSAWAKGGDLVRVGGREAARRDIVAMSQKATKAAGAAQFLNKLSIAGNIAQAGSELNWEVTRPGGINDRLASGDQLAMFDYVRAGARFTLRSIPVVGNRFGAWKAMDLAESAVDKVSAYTFTKTSNFYYSYGQGTEDVLSETALWRLKYGGISFRITYSDDPNDITGPAGFGPEMWIDPDGVMHYTIRFENKPTASAAAYRVEVTLPLDAEFDASTFAFDQVGFAGTTLSGMRGTQAYNSYTFVPTDPNPVEVKAHLDPATRTVKWVFQSFDAITGQLPEDPLAGFLPPNNAAGAGEGFVTFTIRPQAGVAQAANITAQASIVFDTNAPIVTNTHQNAIDNTPPSSAVQPLNPTQTTTEFAVNWSGTDAGSGIVDYTIYVSENGGPYNVWLADTTATSATFTGQPNSTYAFYSIAEDGVGFVEAAPGNADAMTTVQLPIPPTPTPTATPTATATATPPATPTPSPVATPKQLLNLATRLNVQTGENVLIGGLIITGEVPKKVIIRAIGPSLSTVFDGALADPTLELYEGDTLLASNDNWRDVQQTEIEETTIAPSHDLESAIVYTLAPGSYTAVMSGQSGATGIGVIEVYDLDQAADSKLANIASRGFVEAGDNVMIGGLIVGGRGTEHARILIRAIGPSLTKAGVEGALQDPTLELRDSNGELVSENDNWQETQQPEIEATTIPPGDPAESAIVATLPSGDYTAVVRGRNASTGVGLVEVYNVQ